MVWGQGYPTYRTVAAGGRRIAHGLLAPAPAEASCHVPPHPRHPWARAQCLTRVRRKLVRWRGRCKRAERRKPIFSELVAGLISFFSILFHLFSHTFLYVFPYSFYMFYHTLLHVFENFFRCFNIYCLHLFPNLFNQLFATNVKRAALWQTKA